MQRPVDAEYAYVEQPDCILERRVESRDVFVDTAAGAHHREETLAPLSTHVRFNVFESTAADVSQVLEGRTLLGRQSYVPEEICNMLGYLSRSDGSVRSAQMFVHCERKHGCALGQLATTLPSILRFLQGVTVH